MAVSTPVASVIIPAHNASSTISLQISALLRQLHAPPFEVIVVANRCTDDTVEVASSFSDRLNLRVVIADERASSSYARNTGARSALSPLYLFCDADDQVSEVWVSAMVQALLQDTVDAVGGSIYFNRNGLPGWLYRWRYEVIDQTCLQPVSPIGAIPMSGSLGVNATVFNDLGGFDERFSGAGGEEVDFSHRLVRAGYRLGSAPTAVVYCEPRRNLSGALSQAEAYAKGGFLLAAKEGRVAEESQKRLQRFVRTVAHWLIRRRELHPMVYFGLIATELQQRRAFRSLKRSGLLNSADHPAPHDFILDPSVPIIGGLAFAAATKDEALTYRTSRSEPVLVAVLQKFLSPGSTFMDVGAEEGVFSVAAAKIVGEGGKVWAWEKLDRYRESLKLNIVRHRVQGIVEVLPSDVGSPAGSSLAGEERSLLGPGRNKARRQSTPRQLAELKVRELIDVSERILGPVDFLRINFDRAGMLGIDEVSELIRRSPTIVVLVDISPRSATSWGTTVDQLLQRLPVFEWDTRVIDQSMSEDLERLPRVDQMSAKGVMASDCDHGMLLLAMRRQPCE